MQVSRVLKKNEPSFVTKSVRLTRTELSISVFESQNQNKFSIFLHQKMKKITFFQKVSVYHNRKSLQIETSQRKTKTRSKMMLRESVQLQID